MTLPDAVQSRVSDLEARFSDCRDKFDELRSAELDREHDQLRQDEYLPIFQDACVLVREAELANASYLAELTKSIGGILDNELQYALDDEESEDERGIFSLMPSWAHEGLEDRSVIKDENGPVLPFPPAALESFIEIFRPMFGEGVTSDTLRDRYRKDPWHSSMKRHPKSTRMARFRPELPPLTPTSEGSITACILDARCEMFSSPCAVPLKFHISPSCLALTGMAGYKGRSPYIEYIILNEPLEPLVDFPDSYSVTPGLAGIARHAAIDDSRRLIFAGDNYRVKSYEWGSTEKIYDKPRRVHTLDSGDAKGPMTLLPSGSLARAGKGGANVWDIQALPTHGPNGRNLIGERLQDFDSWREESEIERSSGSLPASRIKFFDHPDFEPNLWQPLVSAPSTMVCASKARRSGHYSCLGIDLETGKTTSQYLGHGDEVTVFSTSPSDPRIFLTGCGDGFARLFDLRRPLPAITIAACGLGEGCESAALVMPDGIPTLFTGTGKAEQIRFWDIRARACVYELSTGNNSINGAKIPKDQRLEEGDYDEDEDDEDEDGEDEDAGTDGERCWPKNAWHTEDYFGYLFDAGDHSIIRYTFKQDPNASILPMYGSATVGGQWSW